MIMNRARLLREAVGLGVGFYFSELRNVLTTKIKFMRAGAQGRNRTTDTRIFSPLLYQLSYLGAAGIYE
jgi:hypothetical protein